MVDIKDNMIKEFKLMLKKVNDIKDGCTVMFTQNDLIYYFWLCSSFGALVVLFVISIF